MCCTRRFAGNGVSTVSAPSGDAVRQQREGAADPAQSLADDLALVGQRDLCALRRVYDATAGRLLTLCSHVTGSREAAEDVLQEVYIKVWIRAAGYDPERAAPMAWLAAIARNSAIDAYRARARSKTDYPSTLSEVVDGSKPVDEQLIEEQEYSRAISLIDDLESNQRDHVRDVYFKGMTYSELSDQLGVPQGTIKTRVHRALNLLNRRWNGD
jgi:RNA polymerase sigma factor (sigma-70 family)